MQTADRIEYVGTTDPRWNASLAALTGGDADVYFAAEYHRLCEIAGEGTGVATLNEGGYPTLFVPGMRVAIPNTDRWDLQSCNGYSGPLAPADASNESVGALWDEWIKTSKEAGAVAAFFRMHPLLDNVRWLPSSAAIREDRETVYVALERGVDHVREHASSRHRNMLNRGAKAGASIVWARGPHPMWGNFADIYASAMARACAPGRLNFAADYFDALQKLDCAEIVGMVDGDGLVSAAVFLFGRRWGHYHLAARRGDAPNFAANLLVQAGIERAAELGLEGVHLGGGVTPRADDSLLRFKSSVGGATRRFRVARIVIDPVAFASLSAHAEGTEAMNWLLPYRHPSLRLA